MVSPSPPMPVDRPVMYQTWAWISFLHWSYPPAAIQKLLPEPLKVHTWNDLAWLSVTPFLLKDLRTPLGPVPASFSTFPETNVRTYVRGPDGRNGIWFFSLDAARIEPVLVARATYALPYMWARMTVDRDGDQVQYHSRRRWPASSGAESSLVVDIGAPFADQELGDLDHFLTARWQLYTTVGPVLARSRVEHEPWPLYRAVVRELDGNLITAAGLPAPRSEPLVHWSPGVRTRISMLRPIRRS